MSTLNSLYLHLETATGMPFYYGAYCIPRLVHTPETTDKCMHTCMCINYIYGLTVV